MRVESHGRYWVTSETLALDDAVGCVANPAHGAIATFAGTVRTPSGGREVVGILYEAYEEMAEDQLARIGAECAEKYDVGQMAMAHRVGELVPGDVSVMIAVGAVRRRAALDACAYAIERIKQLLPVWKKERFDDGSHWVGWGGAPTPSLADDAASALQDRSSEEAAP